MSVLRFAHHGLTGQIEVEVTANHDPPSLGCDDDNLMFPACTASVQHPGGGYHRMFGWIQLVRSTDAGESFEIDPNFLTPEAAVPYCYFGYLPTLFDCPGRSHRDDMDWLAHTFLAASPVEPEARLVTPLQGFSWGFTRRDRTVELLPVSALTPSDWDGHLDYLGATFGGWQFAPAEKCDGHDGGAG